MARILSDTGSQGLGTGGGIPTPNWDALADIDAVGGVTRADVVPRISQQLTSESLNEDVDCEWNLFSTCPKISCFCDVVWFTKTGRNCKKMFVSWSLGYQLVEKLV